MNAPKRWYQLSMLQMPVAMAVVAALSWLNRPVPFLLTLDSATRFIRHALWVVSRKAFEKVAEVSGQRYRMVRLIVTDVILVHVGLIRHFMIKVIHSSGGITDINGHQISMGISNRNMVLWQFEVRRSQRRLKACVLRRVSR